MKKAFVSPEFEIISFLDEDIITIKSDPIDSFISSQPDVNLESPDPTESNDSGWDWGEGGGFS